MKNKRYDITMRVYDHTKCCFTSPYIMLDVSDVVADWVLDFLWSGSAIYCRKIETSYKWGDGFILQRNGKDITLQGVIDEFGISDGWDDTI